MTPAPPNPPEAVGYVPARPPAPPPKKRSWALWLVLGAPVLGCVFFTVIAAVAGSVRHNQVAGTQDGLVVTFAPTYEGAQTANLVLNSNDPAFPVVAIPLTGNGVIPEDPEGEDNVGDEEVVTESVDGCGCASADPSAPMAGLLAVAFLARRRRKQA